MEAFITFLLVFVIVAVVTDERANSAAASTSIGFALVAAVLIGGPSTGGAVNPVRALGPMIVSLDLTSFWSISLHHWSAVWPRPSYTTR